MKVPAVKKPRIREGWLRVLLFGVAFFIISLIVIIPALVGLTLSAMKGLNKETIDPAHIITAMTSLFSGNLLWLIALLEFVICLITVVLFRLFIDRKSLSSLGFQTEDFGQEATMGFFMGPVVLGLSALLLLLSGRLHWVDITPDANALFISLGMLVLIAFSEELVFRGYILGNLLESFPNKWIALVISAFLFALFHITNPGFTTLAFANIFLAGLLLGMNYIYTRNLWFSLLFHLSWNFFQGPVFGFRVSGLTLPSLLQTDLKGDEILTGGDFGLEGSLLNILVSLVAVFLLGWAFQRKYDPAPSLSASPQQIKA